MALSRLPIDKAAQAKEWRRRRAALRKASPHDWRERAREERRELKLLEKGQAYDWKAVQAGRPLVIEAFRRQIVEASGELWSPFWQKVIEHRIPSPHRLKEPAVWRTVWLLRFLFGTVLHRPISWPVMAELLNVAEGTSRRTATKLRTGWAKRKDDFGEWVVDDKTGKRDWAEVNTEAYLYADCGVLARRIMSDGPSAHPGLGAFIARLLWRLDKLDTEEGVLALGARRDRLEQLEAEIATREARGA